MPTLERTTYSKQRCPFVKMMRDEGYEPRRALVRSSAWSLYEQCPAQFFWRYRWGLVPRTLREVGFATKPDSPLVFGTYFHWAQAASLMELSGDDKRNYLEEKYDRYIQERSFIAETLEISVDADTLKIDREAFDFATMLQDVSWSVAPLDTDRYEVLGVETKIKVSLKEFKGRIMIQPDAVLRDRATGAVWIWDTKTTSNKPSIRMAVAPFDRQVQLYRAVLQALATKDNTTSKKAKEALGFDPGKQEVPKGFIHHIVQKPNIRVRKTDIQKVGSESAFDIFRERCVDWLRGVGEFADKGEIRRSEPGRNPVTVSHLTFGNLNSRQSNGMGRRLDQFSRACHCGPSPEFYWPTEEGIVSRYGFYSDYAPLYAMWNEPLKWAPIINKHFAVLWREDREDDPAATFTE